MNKMISIANPLIFKYHVMIKLLNCKIIFKRNGILKKEPIERSKTMPKDNLS